MWPTIPFSGTTPQSDAEIAQWLRDLKPIGVIPEKVEAYSAPRREQVRQAVADFRSGAVESVRLEASDYRDP